jgi:hypothetical protein
MSLSRLCGQTISCEIHRYPKQMGCLPGRFNDHREVQTQTQCVSRFSAQQSTSSQTLYFRSGTVPSTLLRLHLAAKLGNLQQLGNPCRARSKLRMFEPSHCPLVVSRYFRDYSRRYGPKRCNQIFEPRVVIFKLPLILVDNPGFVRIEFIPFLADVFDMSNPHR